MIKSIPNIAIDVSRLTDLMAEREKLKKFLEQPKLLVRMSDIVVSKEPIKPKPILYISVAFVSGLFLGIFAVLLKVAYQSYKKEKHFNQDLKGKNE